MVVPELATSIAPPACGRPPTPRISTASARGSTRAPSALMARRAASVSAEANGLTRVLRPCATSTPAWRRVRAVASHSRAGPSAKYSPGRWPWTVGS